jgi:hypothetical protein
MISNKKPYKLLNQLLKFNNTKKNKIKLLKLQLLIKKIKNINLYRLI